MLEFESPGIFLSDKLQRMSSLFGQNKYIHLKDKDGRLVIYYLSEDTNSYIYTQLDCDVKSSGEVSIEGNKLASIVRSLKTNISFKETDKYLSISIGKKKYKLEKLSENIITIQPGNYKSYVKDHSFKIEINSIFKILSKMEFCCAEKYEVGRPFTSTISISFTYNRINFTSTDGHIINNYSFGLENNLNAIYVLPKESIQKLLKIFKGIEGDIKIVFGNTWIAFITRDIQFFTPQEITKWPDMVYLEKLRSQNMDVTINFDEIKDSIDRATIFIAPDKEVKSLSDKLIIFDINDNLNLTVGDEYYESIDCNKSTDGKLTIGFEPNYVNKILKNLDFTDTITMKFDSNSQKSPMLVNDIEGYEIILMPRIIDEKKEKN